MDIKIYEFQPTNGREVNFERISAFEVLLPGKFVVVYLVRISIIYPISVYFPRIHAPVMIPHLSISVIRHASNPVQFLVHGLFPLAFDIVHVMLQPLRTTPATAKEEERDNGINKWQLHHQLVLVAHLISF